MRPEDVAKMLVPGTPTLHGDLLLVDVASPDLTADSYRGGLHRVPLDGSPAAPWTHGDHDQSAQLSPDGRLVAFLRANGKDKPQLHVMPTEGGEPRKLTDLPLGAGAPVWSADSRRIAFTARIPEEGRYGTPLSAEDGAEPPTPDAEAPRRITRLSYRSDGVGFLADRQPRLFVIDALADQPEARQLTDGAFEVASPAWTPDGAHLVFVADRDLGATDTLHSDLYAVPVDGGDPVLVVRGNGSVALPVVTDDTVYFLGEEYTGINMVARNTGLWAAPLRLDGTAVPRRLTDEETVDCEGRSGNPVVTADGVLVCVRNRGAVELRRVPADADRAPLADLPRLAGEHANVKAFAVDGGRIAAVVSTPDSPGEVVLVDGGERVLTEYSAALREAGVRPVRELTGSASDGYPVHGWLVLPEGEGPHPVLLAVHGGPFMYHGWGFFDEAQVYASAGYAVVLPNPRGSAGYGQSHGQAVIGAFGTVDVDDVLSVLDVALAEPECDADRVGVMGGSYGGFMTGWLAAHHGGRFRAAWSERAVNAWDSFTGSSDIGWFFADAYCGKDPDVQRAMSPLTHVDRITMPFAVVHSEQDWRCPLEQGQRMFVALRRNGVDAELLIFPGEGHELTRSGRPRHRRQRFDAVLEWWSRHLAES
ncbi:S9 family peptidase [Solihabitans fulvus]|uniref:S9 family peptidase n=1 Tax=Solihabitans fulvus TaxID=1892852 RepID=A0A5B2XFR9_9PSEU|nr:S9 family peptidase [Solihabitans fulvus]KAA2261642.1 S9 family peptidase [Solihabitans fulvus]